MISFVSKSIRLYQSLRLVFVPLTLVVAATGGGDAVLQGAEPIPDKLVVLTFDDSAKSHFTIVRPILKKYGFNATFFITEGFDFTTNKQDYMTWEEIAQLHQDGFEIGNHTRDHLGIQDNNVDQLAEQLEGINKRCAENGIPKPVTFAWPGNALSKAAFPKLKEMGIRFARRGGAPEFPYDDGRGFALEPGNDHPLWIPSAGDARPHWELDDLKRSVAQARDGRVAVLQFHGAPDSAHSWVSTSQDNFELYMRYLAINQYKVIALRDLENYVDSSREPADPDSIIERRQHARNKMYDHWKNGPSGTKAFFPIAVWLQSPRNAAEYRELGINTYVGLWNGPTAEQLEILDQEGMKIVCSQNEVGMKSPHNNAIIGWMHGDEPDNAQAKRDGNGYDPPILPEVIQQNYQKLRSQDPSRPIFLNLGQGVAYDEYIGRGTRRNRSEDYPEYLKGCDIASFDIYPAVHENPEVAGHLEFVAKGVERLRNWTEPTQIVWNCIECSRICNRNRQPTIDEIRAEVWMSIIHGSRGIIYFVHQFEPNFIEASLLQDAELSRGVSEINRIVHSLADAIYSPETTDAFTIAIDGKESNIASTSRSVGTEDFLFLVNMSNKQCDIQVERTLSPYTGSVEVLGEGREISASDGKLKDTLGPYGVRLYRFQMSSH